MELKAIILYFAVAMKNTTIRLLVLIGVITVIGLGSVQFYLLNTAFNNRQTTFEHSVQVALFQVASRINNYDISQLPQKSPIIKQSSNYYMVDVSREVDCELLEFFLISEFERANIQFDFEYAIYDCFSDEMIYGNYVSFDDKMPEIPANTNFAKSDELVYYFVVHFPSLKTELIGSMKIWFVFALLFTSVLIFIIYAIWVVLGQQRYSELQKTFVSTMTHEFRTPLSASNVAIEYLQQSETIESNARLKKYIELIHLQNTRLNDLIERLLYTAKSEKKTLTLDCKHLNLTEMIENIISGLNATNSNINISFSHSQREIKIFSDEFHAGNIIHALLDNAIKYSLPKPVINLKCVAHSHSVLLSISDNGQGIPRKYKRKIFKQFFRVPTGNIHNIKGFGIGLYYVKLLTRKMKWKVYFENQPVSGTTVVLKIPLSEKKSI